MKFTDKLKLVRKANNLTQAEFASSIGISRGNLANIELGNVSPTPMFINCVALMYGIDKEWLLDDTNSDLGALNKSTNLVNKIMEKYDLLDDKYKKFIENQINQFLQLQESEPDED